MRAALIGKPLGHSYSKDIHEKLGYSYDLLEVEKQDIKGLLRSGGYVGFNVTIPYKKEMIKYLDEIDDNALSVGAVNTVFVRNGRLIGYNTDILGMEYLIKSNGFNLKDKRVMILGTGGTSLTANTVCMRANAKEIITVGRSAVINYENCYAYANVDYIINTTPVGMSPNENACPIEVERFTNLEGVIDVIYNPFKTDLVIRARAMGVKAVGGLQMLVAQAVYAAEIFTQNPFKTQVIDQIYKQIRLEKYGVAFIGMPSSGKTTLAKNIAQFTGKPHIDTDCEIAKLAKKTVPKIFMEDGEFAFRNMESRVVAEFLNKNAVVSTGGGAVLKKENAFKIARNSVVVLVERDVEKLSLEGRPLSTSYEKLKIMQSERMPFYRVLADFCVDNNGEIDSAAQAIREILL